ncbi:hypothetical protein [Nonomuraea sp. CA-141351]|uniref:hypothetical protein n=1 Tax=Nonomuraea sp. CA-141351 TaxID=3239996 RepID=UPI003D93DB6D
MALATGTDLVMSVSQDGTAALWRLHGHGPVGCFAPPTPSGLRELTHVAGTPDGRCWLIGGRGGQVHVLHWSGHAGLVPHRVGRTSWVTDGGDVETLLDDIRHHWDDGPASVAAVREPASGDLGEAWHGTAVDALADLIVNGADQTAREAAVIALAEIDEGKTTALYLMFDRHDSHGSAERLPAYFTGEDRSTTEELIASLPEIDNFLAVLTSAALGERGAAAVPAVHAFPFPTREDADHWFRDESTKYRLMPALRRAGTAAAPALLAVLEDDETEGFSLLLDVLLGMPPAALVASREVGPALDAVRRRFGDGIGTYEENGEIREYTGFEIRLADCIDEKIAEQIKS